MPQGWVGRPAGCCFCLCLCVLPHLPSLPLSFSIHCFPSANTSCSFTWSILPHLPHPPATSPSSLGSQLSRDVSSRKPSLTHRLSQTPPLGTCVPTAYSQSSLSEDKSVSWWTANPCKQRQGWLGHHCVPSTDDLIFFSLHETEYINSFIHLFIQQTGQAQHCGSSRNQKRSHS